MDPSLTWNPLVYPSAQRKTLLGNFLVKVQSVTGAKDVSAALDYARHLLVGHGTWAWYNLY